MGVEAGLDLAVLDRRQELIGGRRRGGDLALVVVHRDGLEGLGDLVELAVDLAAVDRDRRVVAELVAGSCSVRSRNRPARASLPRLSFGAMNRSGPPPLAASSSNFLKRSSNLTSWIVELQAGVGGLDLVGDGLEGGGLGPGARSVRVPEGEGAGEAGRSDAPGRLARGRRRTPRPPPRVRCWPCRSSRRSPRWRGRRRATRT